MSYVVKGHARSDSEGSGTVSTPTTVSLDLPSTPPPVSDMYRLCPHHPHDGVSKLARVSGACMCKLGEGLTGEAQIRSGRGRPRTLTSDSDSSSQTAHSGGGDDVQHIANVGTNHYVIQRIRDFTAVAKEQTAELEKHNEVLRRETAAYAAVVDGKVLDLRECYGILNKRFDTMEVNVMQAMNASVDLAIKRLNARYDTLRGVSLDALLRKYNLPQERVSVMSGGQ